MTPATHYIGERFGDLKPQFAVILGSSLGPFADSVQHARSINFDDVPGFPQPSISGHHGRLILGEVGGVSTLVLEGRVHYYESGDPGVMRPVIKAFAELGIEFVVLTNAAGSLHESVGPGRLMLIRDHINFSGTNPLIGEAGDAGLVPMTNAYNEELARTMRSAANEQNIDLAEGVYLCNSGPMFETPAEIRMAAVIGADAVGMSTVPETILARRFGLRVAGLSAITNMAAGIAGGTPSHGETKRVGSQIVGDLTRLLHSFASQWRHTNTT